MQFKCIKIGDYTISVPIENPKASYLIFLKLKKIETIACEQIDFTRFVTINKKYFCELIVKHIININNLNNEEFRDLYSKLAKSLVRICTNRLKLKVFLTIASLQNLPFTLIK